MMRFLCGMLYLLWCGAVIHTDSLAIRRLSTDIGQGLQRHVRLFKNCSRAALINEDPHVEVRFQGDCSSDVISITHLGFYQPREIVLEFAVESSDVRLLSLKVNVRENSRLKGMFKKSPKLPTLKANQTLSKVLNITGCQARVRRRPRIAPLLGLCGDDPYLWRSCLDILDIYTNSSESDDFVLTVKFADDEELNIAVGLSPKATLPEPSFNSQLRIEVVPRLLSAVQRDVLSTDDRSAFFRVMSLPSSCTFLLTMTRTKVAQFTQEAIDKFAIALYCRKATDETMAQLELVTTLGQTSEPFFLALSTPVDIDLAYSSLVVAGTASTARLTVTSSRDAEIRVVDGLQRGILLADGSPVDSFGTNMSLDYSVQGVGTHPTRAITTDNLVLAFCSFHFFVPVLLVPYEELRLQLNPVRVVPGNDVVLSPKHVRLANSHIGDFNLMLADLPTGGRLTMNGAVVNNISSGNLQDLHISFQAFRNASNSEVITLVDRPPGSVRHRQTVSLLVEYTSPDEDRMAPQAFECSLQLVAHPRNIRVPLDKSNLHFVDVGYSSGTSCARQVTYDVKSLDSAVSGYLGNENGHQISSFSQGDINQGSVFYFPPSVFHRVDGQKAVFEFRVSDAVGNAGPTNNLQVYMEALKISKTVSKHIVRRQRTVVFGSELLSSGYNSSSTVLGVTTLPRSGRLVRAKGGVDEDIDIGDSFSQGDLVAGCVSYHSDFAPTSDTFELLAVNSKDHTLRRRKIKRSRPKRRKLKRNVMQYFKIVVKLTTDDQMTGTEGRQELSLELVVNEGRKSSIVQVGLNFTLVGPPQHGQVFIAVEGDDKAQITYVHSGEEVGLEGQRDQFVLEHSKGVARVHIRIMPVDNSAPIIESANSYEVMEGASVRLDINVFDRDSKAFWCHVTDVADYGRLSLDDEGSLEQFNNTNVEQIVYKQSTHRFVEPTEDHFTIQCSDGLNVSPPRQVKISIIPQNDEIPNINVVNVTVLEGREAPIKVEAIDGDLPKDNLNFRISHLPTHGIVGLLQPNGLVETVVSFSESDLALLMYKHDDSESMHDSFEVTVSDGIHSAHQRIVVKVLAVDDEAPTVLANTGLQIVIGDDASAITSAHLRIVDADSDPATVHVNIIKRPQHGSVWRTDNEADLNQTIIVSSFSWQDLELGRISYTHKSVVCCRDDRFVFTVSDGFNRSPSHVFNVTVLRPPSLGSKQASHRTIETTLTNCSQRLPEVSSTTYIDWIEMSPMRGPVNGELDITDIGQRQAAVEYRMKAELTEHVTDDTFDILLQQAGHRLENVTIVIHWCWLTLSVPSDVSAGETLELEFRRTGRNNTLIEGILESPLGELSFSMLPTVMTKTLPLHVPERLAGRRFLLRLTGVRGCLVYENCSPAKAFSVIVLSSKKDIHFGNDELSVQEPEKPFVKETLFVRVVRKPSSQRADIEFRLHTISGTARPSEDFVPIDKVLTLKAEDDGISIPVEILGDVHHETMEFFYISIEPLEGHVAFRPSRARVTIEDSSPRLAFRRRPLVFAVDPDTGQLMSHTRFLRKGSLLYCATACDSNHPQYPCSGEVLNSTITRYQWKSSLGRVNSTSRYLTSSDIIAPIKSRSFVARTNKRILPGFLYLLPGSRVTCSAKLASIEKGKPDGSWMDSEPYLVEKKPLCGGRAGSRPFLSKLSLDESPAGVQQRSMFSLVLTLPHHDGAIALWSTRSISPGDYQRPLFANKHVCSNIFHVNASDFLSALDLRSCTWNYKRSFSLAELLACGGQLDYSDNGYEDEYDDEVGHTTASTVTISLPVHVMYVIHVSSGKWQHVSVSSILHVAFVYNNWAVGGRGEFQKPHTTPIWGSADVDSVSIDSERNLVLTFRTSTNFRGRLVADKDKARWNESRLTLTPRQGIQGVFLLQLEKQLSDTELLWTLRSLASLPQYTGNYSLTFYPCVGASYARCRLQPQLPPLQFKLPVEVETPPNSEELLSYSMISVMELSLADTWLNMDIFKNQTNLQNDSSNVFHRGESVFGVVRTALIGGTSERSPLIARIRQCFLCRDIARIATPHPSMKSDQQLQHCPYKIIDSEWSTESPVGSSPERSFHGLLASQHRHAFSAKLLERLDVLGADGFTFDIETLFAWETVQEDRPWHVHCIFAVIEESTTTPGRPRRNSAFTNWPKGIVLQKSLELQLADANYSASSPTRDAQQVLMATAYPSIVGVFFSGSLVLILVAAALNCHRKDHTSSIYRTIPATDACHTGEAAILSRQQETLL